MSDQSDFMATKSERPRQDVCNSFDAPIGLRRNWKFRIDGDQNTHIRLPMLVKGRRTLAPPEFTKTQF
jgi:hypothetical protein